MHIDETEEIHRRKRLFKLADETWGAKIWSLTVTNQIIDFIEREGDLYSVGVVTFIKIEIKRCSIVREDLGYASLQGPNKGSILCQARKLSYTNALAAVLESFDNTNEPMERFNRTEENCTPDKIRPSKENESISDKVSTIKSVASNVLVSSTPIDHPRKLLKSVNAPNSSTSVDHTDESMNIPGISVSTMVEENTLNRRLRHKKKSEEELREERRRIQRERQEAFRIKFLIQQNQNDDIRKENETDWESMDDIIISTQDVERAVSEAP